MRLHIITLELVDLSVGKVRQVSVAHHEELVAQVLAGALRNYYNVQIGTDRPRSYSLRCLAGPAAVEVVEAMPRGMGGEMTGA